ncbi:MAG: FMN-binding protein [Ruminococcus sp.]|jgi:major membrane immunogen (membrane-anchored lipoprotein)|nr:FMN-binding protein [Ruminococcus sp.]
MNIRMIKLLCLSAAVAASSALCLCSCGSKTYKDGTYTARSAEFTEEQDGGGSGYGEVELTISGGKITSCTFKTYELDGTLKGEDYGKENGEIKNRDYYNKAQKANAARAVYAEELVNKGSADQVDAVSGATINYDQFTEAVAAALAQAEE